VLGEAVDQNVDGGPFVGVVADVDGDGLRHGGGLEGLSSDIAKLQKRDDRITVYVRFGGRPRGAGMPSLTLRTFSPYRSKSEAGKDASP
jgi:hypothetical protein